MPTIKAKTVKAIGLRTVKRPRDLQIYVKADEHNLVHVLYRLQKDGLVTFRTAKNLHGPGTNLTDIRLTRRGIAQLVKPED